MTTILSTALELHTAGVSVVPVRADGSKAPATNWKPYTQLRATTAQLQTWFDNWTTQGIGIITGAISRNLELLEFEGRVMNRLPEVLELLDGAELLALYQRILGGWAEQSPSGGLHLFYKITDSEVPGNTKIATRPSNNEELAANPTQKWQTLVETRGEGGFVVLAPSAGTVHPTGLPWVRLTGGPTTVASISRAERDALHQTLAAILDETPEPAAHTSNELAPIWSTKVEESDEDLKPGDDFEARTDWAEILEGWTLVGQRGTTRYWRRPGKQIGLSATTGHAQDRDRLYVFSSSTEFTPEVPYTKFGAYALLKHGGDHSAAARELASSGYGHRAPRALTPPNGRDITASAENIPANIPTPTGETTPNGRAGGRAPETSPTSIPETVATTLGDDTDYTDTGNARLAATEYSNTLKYVPDAGKWVHWTGSRWAWQPDDAEAIQAALDIAERLPDTTKAEHAHRLKSLSARSLANARTILQTMPQMRVPADQFDHQPYELNTPDGIINLRTGEQIGPLPTHYHSMQTRTHLDTNQATPLWSAFLEQTFEGDQAMITYVQRLTGLSAIGEVLENILPFLRGGGGNGKGVFLETIKGVLGDYAQSTPANFLMAARDQHPTELAKLRGTRFVIASEINEGTKFDEAKMKLVTGGDTISARFMRGDFFEFTPTHTLWLMGNSQPKVETGGPSFWRRLRLIPFTHTVTEEQKVENLQERLIENEGPGILHWIIQGAVNYLKDGLQEPLTVRLATDTYKQEEDHLGRFIDERCKLGGGTNARALKTEVRAAYVDWCHDNGEHELNATQFGRQLKAKYSIGDARSHGKHYYVGITVYADENTLDPDDKDTYWK